MRTRRSAVCRLCGSAELDFDEVLEAGVLRLAACVRCDHRWTERPLVTVWRARAPAETEPLEAA